MLIGLIALVLGWPAQAAVPVAIVVPVAQFEDQAQRERLDSAIDLRRQLDKRSSVVVVDPPGAVITLEIVGRWEEAQETRAISRTTSRAYRDKVLRVKLSIGEYSTEIVGRSVGGEYSFSTSWGVAAGDVARQVEKWVTTNRAKLPALVSP